MNETLNRISELAREAKGEGLYQVCVGVLDARGSAGFRVLTRDGYWRFIGGGSRRCLTRSSSSGIWGKIEGRIQYRAWEERDGGKRSRTDIVASAARFPGNGEQRREREGYYFFKKPSVPTPQRPGGF